MAKLYMVLSSGRFALFAPFDQSYYDFGIGSQTLSKTQTTRLDLIQKKI
jgi:hypothetical protein